MKAGRFTDFTRGGGWHISGRNWTVAMRKGWRFYTVRPHGKPGCFRIYLGPLEFEYRTARAALEQSHD